MLPDQLTMNSIKSQAHLHFFAEAMDRNLGENFCPLAVDLVHAVHESRTTIPHKVCQPLSEREICHTVCDPTSAIISTWNL
jgi:hypothetical protein